MPPIKCLFPPPEGAYDALGNIPLTGAFSTPWSPRGNNRFGAVSFTTSVNDALAWIRAREIREGVTDERGRLLRG